jgi:hypothetical protein
MFIYDYSKFKYHCELCHGEVRFEIISEKELAGLIILCQGSFLPDSLMNAELEVLGNILSLKYIVLLR